MKCNFCHCHSYFARFAVYIGEVDSSSLQVLDRGEKIELLVDKTENLRSQVSPYLNSNSIILWSSFNCKRHFAVYDLGGVAAISKEYDSHSWNHECLGLIFWVGSWKGPSDQGIMFVILIRGGISGCVCVCVCKYIYYVCSSTGCSLYV